LGDFYCECGAQIETPVTPCNTNGCKHKGKPKPIFTKLEVIGKSTIKTIGLPTGGYQTTVVGGSLSGEKWDNDELEDALKEHEDVVSIVKVVL